MVVSVAVRKRIFLCACLAGMLLASQPAAAQDGGSFVSLAHNLASTLIGILSVMMGILGIGSIFMSIVNLMNGKQDSAKKFIWSFIGLSIGYGGLSVIRNYAGTTVSASDSLTAAVASVLSSALCVVSIISLVGIIIKVMNAEEQSYNRLYTWLIVSVVGIMLLQIFAKRGSGF